MTFGTHPVYTLSLLQRLFEKVGSTYEEGGSHGCEILEVSECSVLCVNSWVQSSDLSDWGLVWFTKRR